MTGDDLDKLVMKNLLLNPEFSANSRFFSFPEENSIFILEISTGKLLYPPDLDLEISPSILRMVQFNENQNRKL